MKLLLQVALVTYINFLHAQPTDKTDVVASLNATVTLRCSFPFIRGQEGLSVVWEKNDQDGRWLIAHKFTEGQNDLKEQDISYTGRTELSEDFSYGRVDLTLREVTFNDNGTYFCRAANRKGHGDKQVDLTIDNGTDVVALLYANVTLWCSFPFIRGQEGLTVVWEKNDKDGRRMIAHMFTEGRDNLKEQDISYTGRTKLSEDFSHGRVDLILREVTFNDKGTYYCKAANGKGHGDKKVDLTIDNGTDVVASLHATVTLRCSFPFIRGQEGLTVVWEKNYQDGRRLIAHKFTEGRDNLTEQDVNYTGHTELSEDFSHRRVDLTLREVTFNDKGTYYCRATNGKGHGDKKVHLTIGNGTDAVVSLYANVTLRCSFPFIRGQEGLSVVWEKNDKDGRRMIAHMFTEGRDNLKEQDMSYTGRTKLSEDFSHGTVDLILREVTFNDEGTYYCRAANGKGHGDKKVDLTIGNLNAAESTCTSIHIDGKKRLKCINIGVFRNPWVRWYDEQLTDLSEHGTRKITDISNGRKMVESVLNLDVEANKPYFCLVKEGRLKRTARAVLSDGKTVSVPETKLPE
ncbi:CD276 antigen-like [Aquarana catesbeiana]|uniref:CD276 antigen-like n=1 Tax=Aquarana catesbeiana TaxID=8400 RepID=UPI003CC9781A